MAEKQVLNLDNFSSDAQRVFLDAIITATHRFNHKALSAEHYLWAILDNLDTHAYRILDALKCNQSLMRIYITQALRRSQSDSRVVVRSGSFSLPLSQGFGPILNKAQEHAKRSKAKKIGTDHILLAMVEIGSTNKILQTAGVTPTQVMKVLEQIHRQKKAEPEQQILVDLVNLVRLKETRPPFVAKPQVVRSLMSNLLDKTQQGVILVGEEGSGRWFQILGLADELKQIKRRKQPFGLIAINPDAYLSDPVLTMQEAVTQARKTDSVLVVPNLDHCQKHTDVSYLSAGELLQIALRKRDVKIVGITTPQGFRENLESESTFSRLPLVQQDEASLSESQEILKVLAPSIAKGHGVKLETADLEAAVDMAYRFLPGALPGKAIALFSAACAEVRRAKLTEPETDGIVDESDFAIVIERRTGIPTGKTLGPKQERLAKIEETIHQRYVNQDHALTTVCRAVRHGRSAFKDKKRPIGAFLFLGPTGVGKTELGKALAEFLFGSEDALIVINMTEYQEKHTVSALLGTPAGYVGYGEKTQLTEVKERPYSIVLLDEFDKAHQEVQLAFMQAIEEGYLKDRRGDRIDFRNTIIIMTTNVGTEYLKGEDSESEKARALATVKAHFRPEFLNRIDAQVVFQPLTIDDLVQILGLMLKKTIKEAHEEGLSLVVNTKILQQIVRGLEKQCREYGARPLRRAVDDLEQTITDQLVTGKIGLSDTITVALQGNKLVPIRH